MNSFTLSTISPFPHPPVSSIYFFKFKRLDSIWEVTRCSSLWLISLPLSNTLHSHLHLIFLLQWRANDVVSLNLILLELHFEIIRFAQPWSQSVNSIRSIPGSLYCAHLGQLERMISWFHITLSIIHSQFALIQNVTGQIPSS